eukprot:TRINITY_DN2411_c0_g1_i1.p3 TRINITY_DN2411_c0_g1~~TRINITY_DN2411_c0_g1_i1.p3  ORF type:complete len:179 (-),score=5.89 TRINITY_DN2411_c0_g1_i1:903-1439(-)
MKEGTPKACEGSEWSRRVESFESEVVSTLLKLILTLPMYFQFTSIMPTTFYGLQENMKYPFLQVTCLYWVYYISSRNTKKIFVFELKVTWKADKRIFLVVFAIGTVVIYWWLYICLYLVSLCIFILNNNRQGLLLRIVWFFDLPYWVLYYGVQVKYQYFEKQTQKIIVSLREIQWIVV